jgi:hypothetical protein
MKTHIQRLLIASMLLFCPQVFAQEEAVDELTALREEIRQMREEYETRIADLEARLDAAERAAPVSVADSTQVTVDSYAAAPVQSPQTVSVARDNSFNPAIGVTFQGQAWSYGNDPDDYHIVIEDGEVAVELEEAWVETLALPAGLSLRMGRFFSGIGYLNSKHFHAWDFADQPLAYQVLLGNSYIDDGLQLRWLAPTDFYLEVGAEVLRGDRYPAGGAAHSGVGSTTLSIKTGGDIGFSNSWLFGLSWLGADADERASGDEDSPLLFTGSTDLLIADFVWKWAPNGNSRQQNFKIQAEYLWRQEDGIYLVPDSLEGDWNHDQGGWYLQAVYQPFPRWRFGARIDRLFADTPDADWLDTPLYPMRDDPSRYSLMVDWSNSEFSRLRLQYNHDSASERSDNQFGLQYIFSIGAHGAHSF